MNRCRETWLGWFVMTAALAGALALSGCGRKGPLEPPPSTVVQPQAVEPEPGVGNPLKRTAPSAPAAFDPEGRPRAAPGAKKSLPIDWLIE